ncbi:MAG: hypothetical protein IK077_15895 [Thermoguttaceae bacterium]|nr:hypothetical protein [Thermoguttaceae bacterium]
MNRRIPLIGATLLAAFFAFWICSARADEPSGSSSTAARESAESQAFQKSIKKSRFPWLSPETGEVKYLPREAIEVPKSRPVRNRSSSDSQWGGAAFTVVCWAVILTFFVVAIIAIALAIRSMVIKKALLKRRLAADAQARERRINALAPEAAEQYDDLLLSAEKARADGDYRQALVFYFSYLLVEMDKREFVLLAKGKTNLEYWRELADFTELRTIYRATMNEFERVYFGGASISREEFERVWSRRPRFEDLMREKDEEERLRREAEELKRQSTGVGVSASVVLIAAVMLASCFGCSPKKEERWKSSYSSYANSIHAKSLNSVTAYLDYCRRNTKWKLKTVPYNHLSGEEFADLTKNQDAIICFDSPEYGDMPVSSPFWSDVWLYPRAKDRSIQVQAMDANLRRYAQASDDDFDRFSFTETTYGFYQIEKEVAWWLNEKPNRTFILVARGWDALPFYLLDARQATINSGAPEYDPKLRECDELLAEYMRQVKSLLKPVEIKENDGDFVFPSNVPLLLERHGGSPKLTFSRNREEKRELLKEPLKRLGHFVRIFDDDESEEAEKLLPRELVEEVVSEVDKIVKREITSNRSDDSDGSVDMSEVFGKKYDFFSGDLDSWNALSFDEKWRVAFTTIKNANNDAYTLKNDMQEGIAAPVYFDEWQTTPSSFRHIFDDGTDWPTASSVDEEDATTQDGSKVKLPPDPLFVTRFVPSSFGDWPDVGYVSKDEKDEFLDPQRLVRKGKFSGDPKWTEGLPEEARLREFCKIEPRGDTKVLLAQGDIPLICERKIGESRLLIVNSTSFLSNYALTDPVNQALAAKLTRELSPRSKTLVFLEMLNVYDGIPEIAKKEDGPFSLKKLTPFTIFIWHLVFLGACAIFCAYPIFGRPKRLGRERMNDFSRHVNAYASELESIGAREWTQEQIDAYRNSDNLPEL